MREKIGLGLESENRESRPLWKPMHQQPLFAKKTYLLQMVFLKNCLNGVYVYQVGLI